MHGCKEVLTGRLQMFRGMMAALQKMDQRKLGQGLCGPWSDCFGADKDAAGEMWLHDGVQLY